MYNPNYLPPTNFILPTVYDKSLSYEEQICKILELIKNIKPVTNINNNTYNVFDPNYLKDSELQTKAIRSYSFENMQIDIDTLCTAYPNIRVNNIGISVLGLPLTALEYGSSTATRHLFVFNGLHGNEASSSIALAQLEVLAKNDIVNGINIWDEILTNDTCVHVIPNANPDAWMLGLAGFSYFPNITEAQKDFIKTNLEDYIRNYAKAEPNGSNWDAESRADLENYIRSLGGDPSISYSAYVFREEDLHCWEGNVNGIDLHYNWYTDEMKPTVDLALQNVNHGHPNGYVYGAQGARPYVDENAIYYNYIKSFQNSTEYYFNFLNYHQKGPTNIWNYRLEGLQNNRSYDCGVQLCELMQVPYSKYVGNQSTPIGFTAWCGINYKNDYTLAYTCEVGWSSNKLRGDWWNNPSGEKQRSPVPDIQWENIYISNKGVLSFFVRYYTSLRDIDNRHQGLNEYNITDDIYNTTRFSIPSMNLIRQLGTSVGYAFTSLSKMGLTATATLNDVLSVLNYTGSLKMSVTPSLTISNDMPSWSYSSYGTLWIYPVGSKMIIEFRPLNIPLVYQKILDKASGSEVLTDWINITAITVNNYNDFGLTKNTSFATIASKVKLNHSLAIDIDSTWTITDKPALLTETNYRIEISGRLNNNKIFVTGINSGNIYTADYSRTAGTIGTWRVIKATTS